MTEFDPCLMTKVLFELKDWARLGSHLCEPMSDEELAQVFRAFEELRDWTAAQEVLNHASASPGFDQGLISELSNRLKAGKLLSR